MAWIEDDELVEVTPVAVRVRRAYLDPNERKRRAKASAQAYLPRFPRCTLLGRRGAMLIGLRGTRFRHA